LAKFRVDFAPAALEQAEAVHAWWHEYRPAAPTLFRDELEAAVRRLEDSPRLGVRYEKADVAGMRRLLLPRTRYHVYFVVEEAMRLVRVHAIWHAARGRGPALR